MKKMTNWIAFGMMLATSTLSFAQKANETSAALEFKKYMPAMAKGDLEAAKKALLKAKDFIDLAAAHPDTKESPKTLYYKGEIYSNFLTVGMQSMDTSFLNKAGADAFDVAIAAYKQGYDVSDKFDEDIKSSIMQKKGSLELFTNTMFTNKLYKEAIEIYDYQVKLSSALSIVDTQSYYNAGICAERGELWETAAKYYSKCAELGYNSPEIYKTVAICLIKANKREDAYAYLNKAIEKNPNDAQLYYVIGTMYMETNDNQKAIDNLKKALEKDPKLMDANYQLGAFLLELGSKLRKQANELPLKDPNFDKYIKESTQYYNEALVPLETYIKAFPDDKAVLTCLYQIHRTLKNTEKEQEYKKRIDAIK